MDPEPGPGRLLSSHAISRRAALGVALALGVAFGIANAFVDVDFSFGPGLLLAFAAAVVLTTLAHEGVHSAAGLLLGHRPVFGFHPPFVYTTFRERVTRGRFLAVALAPLLALDAAALALLAAGIWPLFADLALAVNTIGSIGDLWMVRVLLRAPRGSWVQDTKTGF
ncbi:MAG: DUF3267 domain-containing protein [Planctomycetes bacterium]|jgi:hypothetical protein|nr:DUF3267 domain-containing protein [Planctomycetota bacterium]